MKKIIPLFLAVAMMFCLCACGGDDKNVSFEPAVNKPFIVTAEIENGDQTATAVIRRYGTANWDVEFSAPNTLAGVLLSFRDDNVEASYKGLSFSVPKSALPLKSMITNLIDTVDSMAALTEITCEEDDGLMKCEGETEQGKYTIKFNKDGSLAGFEMPNFDLEMEFSGFSEDSSELPESTATEAVTEAAPTESETSETEAGN